MSDATRLLEAIGTGDPQASAELLPVVYDELRRLARAQMASERTEHTLQATALVHEAYLRLVEGGDGRDARWDGRRHFFAAAAEAMRRILIEHARRRHALKRGGGQARVELSEDGDGADVDGFPAIASPCDDVADLLSLDDALTRLAREHPDKAALIKLVYFAGLSLDEAAAASGLSKSTAHRYAVFARAWLYDAMGRPDP